MCCTYSTSHKQMGSFLVKNWWRLQRSKQKKVEAESKFILVHLLYLQVNTLNNCSSVRLRQICEEKMNLKDRRR